MNFFLNLDEILLCFEKVWFAFDLFVSFVFYLFLSCLFWSVGLKTARSSLLQCQCRDIFKSYQPVKELPDVLCNCPVKSHASHEKLTEKLSPLFHISWVLFRHWWQRLLGKKLLCMCRKVILLASAQGTSVPTLCSWPVRAQHAWSDITSQGMAADLSGIIKAPIYYRVHCLKNPWGNLVV